MKIGNTSPKIGDLGKILFLGYFFLFSFWDLLRDQFGFLFQAEGPKPTFYQVVWIAILYKRNLQRTDSHFPFPVSSLGELVFQLHWIQTFYTQPWYWEEWCCPHPGANLSPVLDNKCSHGTRILGYELYVWHELMFMIWRRSDNPVQLANKGCK